MSRRDSEFFFLKQGGYAIGADSAVIDRYANAGLPEIITRSYLENNVPRHEVALAEVGISRFLVRVAEFGLFAAETGYLTDAEKEGWGWTWREGWRKREGLNWRKPFGNEADAVYADNAPVLPVLQVSWNDASAYCVWLAQKRGETVRLPSEAEWEAYAEMMGTTSLSDGIGSTALPAPSYETGAYIELLRSSVGEEEAHATGLVWEWTEDWFDAYPGGPVNREFGKVYKVLRGGSLMSHQLQKCREYRFRRCPTARSPFYGFRIAVEGAAG